ncbi:MAG: hypothetical protein SFV51_03215 [Bryobacteraceae bacterium]|nr:hypothetical protein [Bryobacteraceae bacterium]
MPRTLLVCAVALECGFAGLLAVSPLRYAVVEAIAILIGSSAVYLIAVARDVKGSQWALWIVGWSVVLRLTAFAIPPDFTDDLYRYRWEARLQEAGGNPYRTAPNDESAVGLRDATFDRIPGRDFRAVYGPMTELAYRLAFRAVAALTGDPWRQVFWLKLPGALGDLGVLAGLWWLLPAAGVPRERILVYAWCPLPVFEFWTNGHNDTLMLVPLVCAFLALARGRAVSAFSLLATAVSAKVWPLALIPVFAGMRPGKWLAALAVAPVIALWMSPFDWGLAGNAPFLSGFLGGWRNNDSLYGLLLWLTGDQYPAKYAAFGIVFGAIAWVTLKGEAASRGSLAVIVVMLLVSANCHPWYLTWMLPLVAIHRSWGLLTWIALSPLFYLVLPRWFEAGEWNGSTPERWAVYAPVFAVLVWEGRRSIGSSVRHLAHFRPLDRG